MAANGSKPSKCADPKHLAALNSLYYHAYNRGGAAPFLLPTRLRPMEPQQAVDALEDAHPDARQLALAKIFAGGLEKRYGLSEGALDRLRKGLEKLPNLKKIKTSIVEGQK